MSHSPTLIKLRRAENLLELTFEDNSTARLSAELLRVESPSAGQPAIVHAKRHVAIIAIEPTGNYAIRLIFSDGHDTGIYSWDFLHQLGREQHIRWRRYLHRLEEAGLSRD